ncbi:DNA sulfur modification protein DndE [Saccharibacillus sp. CPCC 101409]|uniref:DNA sulfur modification protein DndE n=1 Tax=Saccharibacillus sp. CPCC 101409 TaxID=3058041 RepID=UPI0026710DCF|nr:DNA sulfur modification protein DndE [Saccharibacillus sp. CPCC 101409]MDO3408388.1 DNA sulfur modification protein DndE [Saccharibacillus sp. CPCC 101409]
MNFTLRTSKYAKDNLTQLSSATSITPNILIRYAVSLSLRNSVLDGQVEPVTKDFTDGLVLNRNTVTGEYDYVFKALITQVAGKELTDEEYFPGYFNAHLERGIRSLAAEYKSAGNSERFIRALIL